MLYTREHKQILWAQVDYVLRRNRVEELQRTLINSHLVKHSKQLQLNLQLLFFRLLHFDPFLVEENQFNPFRFQL